jgi:UDP-N-acetylglucosamine 1-carboxyvinyltransferase
LKVVLGGYGLKVRKLVIEGARRLRGEVEIQGAKNSILPILAAALLCGEECIINNCPKILDVEISFQILNYIGCKIEISGSELKIDASGILKNEIPESLMRKMRSSIIFLGALIARTGKAKLTLPGGCELGPRPIDMHLDGLKQLGVKIDESHGKIECSIINKLKGNSITLSFPSVGATENLMIAASACEGRTIINNAACEPEIIDLANFLNKMGAAVRGAGSGTIVIEGTKKFCGTQHSVISDRIVAITYMAAAAITGGELVLKKIPKKFINSSIPIFEEAGCFIKEYDNNVLKISSPERLQAAKIIRTMPYPGFPTDAQAIVMAAMTIALGTSVFVETIFESRFKHVCELARLGANIKVEGKVAIVEGVNRLSGANVTATDLRGAAALVIAALSAEGKTTISNLMHLDRGYENIEQILSSLGANIQQTFN